MKADQELTTQNVMEKVHVLKLIDGNFTPTDAGKILNELITSKINYHNREMLSIRIKYDGDVSRSEGRIEQLVQVRDNLNKLLAEAEENGHLLKINSSIDIVML